MKSTLISIWRWFPNAINKIRTRSAPLYTSLYSHIELERQLMEHNVVHLHMRSSLPMLLTVLHGHALSKLWYLLRIVALNVFIMLTFSQFEIRVAHLNVPVWKNFARANLMSHRYRKYCCWEDTLRWENFHATHFHQHKIFQWVTRTKEFMPPLTLLWRVSVRRQHDCTFFPIRKCESITVKVQWQQSFTCSRCNFQATKPLTHALALVPVNVLHALEPLLTRAVLSKSQLWGPLNATWT